MKRISLQITFSLLTAIFAGSMGIYGVYQLPYQLRIWNDETPEAKILCSILLLFSLSIFWIVLGGREWKKRIQTEWKYREAIREYERVTEEPPGTNKITH